MSRRLGKWRSAAFVAITAVCILVAAPTHSTAAATRAEYVAIADPECADATKDIGRLNRRFRQLHDRAKYEQAGRVLGKTGVRLTRSVKKVRAIPPPPGDEQLVSAWLDLIAQVGRNNKAMGRAQAREDFAEHDRLFRRNGKIRAKAHRLVAGCGFEPCA